MSHTDALEKKTVYFIGGNFNNKQDLGLKWSAWKDFRLILFQKLIYLLFPPWNNMYVVLPFVAKVSTYKTHIFFLQNVSVWHPQKFELMARRSIEVWEVALYVFFERDAIFLECSKANFDEFWKFFDIKFWCHTLTHGIVLRRLPQVWSNWKGTS